MNIVVVGLGYVGWPLAYHLSEHFDVTGFDIDIQRVEELQDGIDRTDEVVMTSDSYIKLTSDESCIKTADIVIITVPTPIDNDNSPDLTPLLKASKMVGENLKLGATVVYESTVWPGLTQEKCIPLLESGGLIYKNRDFHVGYSPERINPGDKVHTLSTVTKIVSGDSKETLDLLDSIYSKITTTFKASSIKTAEAAKVIENIQRDVNIALVNEISNVLFELDIDTADVLDAAASKWNFLRFEPGFVGGHCIGVDPYYFIDKARRHGYVTDLISSARKINESVPYTVSQRIINELHSHVGVEIQHSRILVLGCTFKENVPDIRNSKVFSLIDSLDLFGATVHTVDPRANPKEVAKEYDVTLYNLTDRDRHSYDVVVLAVAHHEYTHQNWNLISKYLKKNSSTIVFDVKSKLDRALKPNNVTLLRL